jgi:hypothetical protein
VEAAAQVLSAVGLVIGTVDYSLLIRRRAARRRQARQARMVEETGLQGLVRVLLADEHPPEH